MSQIYFMLASGILGLNIGLTPREELRPFVVFVLWVASVLWPIYLAVWAYHRYFKKMGVKS